MERVSGSTQDIRSQGETLVCCGDKYPRRELIFVAQTLLVYIVCIASIANLTRGAEQQALWTCLLSSALGYMLPNPKVKSEYNIRRPIPIQPSVREDIGEA